MAWGGVPLRAKRCPSVLEALKCGGRICLMSLISQEAISHAMDRGLLARLSTNCSDLDCSDIECTDDGSYRLRLDAHRHGPTLHRHRVYWLVV